MGTAWDTERRVFSVACRTHESCIRVNTHVSQRRVANLKSLPGGCRPAQPTHFGHQRLQSGLPSAGLKYLPSTLMKFIIFRSLMPNFFHSPSVNSALILNAFDKASLVSSSPLTGFSAFEELRLEQRDLRGTTSASVHCKPEAVPVTAAVITSLPSAVM
eukprot:1905375-Prymnesium_polylepis.1